MKEVDGEHVYFCYVDPEDKEIYGVPPEICNSGYDSIDKILSARFHNILNHGTAYNEVKYCIQDFDFLYIFYIFHYTIFRGVRFDKY